MSMPHPRVLMIPFGAVIAIKQNRSRTWVDLYTGASKIDGLHPALKGHGAIIAPNDDLPVTSTYINNGHPSVIAAATVTLKNSFVAYKLHNVKGATIATVKAAEFQQPMHRNHFYWLEPAKKPAKKKMAKKK
jgi:hypothetical protein